MHPSRILAAVLALALVAPTGLTDWSQYRHDDEHTGIADLPGAIQAEYKPWTFDADGSIVSSPAVTDVDGETTIVFGSYTGTNSPGTVYALDADGQTRWSTSPLGSTGGYIASPTVEDLDQDGDKEVVVPSMDDSRLRVFDAATGEQEWSTQVGSTSSDLLASSPIVADLSDEDGKEIAFGGSVSGDDGNLLIYDDEGDQLQAIELDGPSWSTPLYQDLDDDGEEELALATGIPSDLELLFPSAKTGGNSLYVFENGEDGWSIDWSITLNDPTLASPVAGDLDDDGEEELVIGDESGTLWVADAASGQIEATSGAIDVMGALSSPVVADIDGDDVLEIAIGLTDGVRAFELQDGAIVQDGTVQLPYQGDEGDIEPWVGASLAIQDVDGDGVLDLLGTTVPVNVDPNNLLDSDALPGTVFAVNGSNLAYPEGLIFSHRMPDDGGLSGPVFADVDGDERSEILAGEGVPVIGNGSTLHYLDAANPVLEDVTIEPIDPETVDEVTFTAEATDENTPDDELTYDWDFGDDATATGSEVTHSYADDGTYLVEVEVSDPEGYAWVHQRWLDVVNVAPDIDAEATTTPDSLEVSFTATSQDPDGTVASTTWHLGDGTTTQDTSLTHTYDTGGTYEAVFEAVDDDGAVGTQEVRVEVNRLPTLGGPETAETSEAQALVVELPYDDPDGDEVQVASIEGAADASAQVLDDHVELVWLPPHDVATRANTPASVDVTVTIEDEGAPTGSASHTLAVDVHDTNRAPDITGPDALETSSGQTRVAEGTIADPDGDAVTASAEGLPSYASFEQEDESWEITLSPPASVTASTHDVTIRADDGLDEATHDLALEVLPNQPPVVDVEGPSLVEAHTVQNPASATFEGTAEDPDGDAVPRWSWSMGPITHQDRTLTHAFPEHGTYTLSLTAWDANQASATTTHTVEVDDALTGDVLVQPSETGPHVDRLLRLQASYDDGTPLADTEIAVSLYHESLEEPTLETNLTTDADGRLQTHLEGEMGLPFFLPGDHTLEIEAEAPSLAGAVVQDTETLAMSEAFHVTPT